MKLSMLYIFSIVIILLSCSQQKDGTILNSSEIKEKNERIDQLKNEVRLFSEILDTEYELFNINGFSNQRTTIPGASSWDYKFVIKINSSEIDKWTKDWDKFDNNGYDSSWMGQIIKHRPNTWNTTSTPLYYRRNDSDAVQIVYKQEGIIFKRVKAD